MALPLKKPQPLPELEVAPDPVFDLIGMHHTDHEGPMPMSVYLAREKRRQRRLVAAAALALIAIISWSLT